MTVRTIDLIQDRAWAIYPSKLDEINAVLLSRLNGQDFEGRKTAAEDPKSAPALDTGYEVVDGVAVIGIFGTLFKRANLLMEFSGGTSYDLLKRDLASALADPAVGAILLHVESPGGTVDGCYELAQFVRASRGQKPIIAYADGLMASAAYLIACQADTILASNAALVGSIGVISMHYDRSEADKQWGVKRTAIAAGVFKDAGGDHRPLEEKDASYLQGIVDNYYGMFVAEVAAARSLTEKQIRATEAKVFVGQDAVDNGLADGVATFEQALKRAKEQVKMDKETLKAQHAALYQSILEEGRQKAEAESKTKIDAAVAAEKERCEKIVEAQGSQTLTLKAIKENTSPGDHALAVLKDLRENPPAPPGAAANPLAGAAANPLAGLDAPPPVAGAPKTDGAQDFMGLVKKHQAENPSLSLSSVMAAMEKAHPDAHKAWLASHKR